MNKAISDHFKKLGKAGGKKSWEVRKKMILEKAKKVEAHDTSSSTSSLSKGKKEK